MARKLYIDGFQYAKELGFIGYSWNLDVPRQRIRKLVQAANLSGIILIVFMNASIRTGDALVKWRERCENEIKDENHGAITCQNVLMAELFQENGVSVYYSPVNVDCNDCIMSHAYHDRASILSNNNAIFRYVKNGKRPQYTNIYSSYIIREKVILIKKEFPSFVPPQREIIDRIPLSSLKTKDPGLIEVKEHKRYLRGVPSPLSKIGNPHAPLVNLRQVLYAKFGIDEVEEEWPIWKDGPTWHREKVKASVEHVNMFNKKPMEIVRLLYGESKKSSNPLQCNHMLAQKILVCELYSIYHNMRLLDALKIV
jgi:hypothetical protein